MMIALLVLLAGMALPSGQSHAADFTVIHQGIPRQYRVYAPPANGPRPAVILLHGSEGSGPAMEALTGFDAVADANGLIAVYPSSLPGQRWNDGRDPSSAIDDIGFLDAVVAAVRSRWSVQDVYLAGFSNGGGMTLRAACERSSAYRAFVAVASSLPATFEAFCRNAQPVPLLLIYGTFDPFIRWGGGPVPASADGSAGGGETKAVEFTADFFIALWGRCGDRALYPLPRLPVDQTRMYLMEYSGCEGSLPMVFLVTVDGMGHAWPGAPPRRPADGPASYQFSASTIIWEFFSYLRSQ